MASRLRSSAALLLAALLFLGTGPAVAEEAAWPPVELADSGRHDFLSAINGRPYRVFLRRPPGPAPATGFPVIYLLDGNAYFPQLAELARLSGGRPERSGVAPAVVVGIGYPPEEDIGARRFLDLTPEPQRPLPPRPDGRPWPTAGGAASFAEVIEREVKPLVEHQVPVDPSRQTLVGHSLGGLFVLHSLFAHPGSFRSYVAASPSIWFDGRRILEEAEGYLAAAAQASPARLLVTVGSLETSPGPGLPAAARPQDGMAGMAQALAERLGAASPEALEMRFLLLEGEDHLSVVPATLSRALRFGAAAGETPGGAAQK